MFGKMEGEKKINQREEKGEGKGREGYLPYGCLVA